MSLNALMLRGTRGPVLPLALLALAGSTASATWSILIADTRTGEIAVGSATCLSGFDLRAETPVLLLGRGAITAQSAVDSSGMNRARAFEGFAKGLTPAEIFAILEATDPGHSNRQYGMIDVLGNTLTFSGADNADFAGGVTGRIEAGAPGPADDIVYAVQGNILTGEPVVLAAESAILNTPGDLAEKLMAGMEAARVFGGDGRCSCSTIDPTGCGSPPDDFLRSAIVGYMLVGRLGDRDPATSYMHVDSAAQVVLTDDLDGDGSTDLVIGPSFGGPVTFARQITAHTGDPLIFESTPITGVVQQISAAATIDADADGDRDIALLTQTGSGILIPSNGDSTFAGPIETPLGFGVGAGVAGPFTAGGGPGFVAGVPTDNTLRTLAVGPAGFAAVASMDLPASPVDVARTPGGVAVALADRSILPLSPNGDGTFTPGPVVALGGIPINVMAGDLNGDGVTDYAYARTDRRVGFVLSQPGDTFAESTTLLNGPIRDSVMTDLDGDGDLDVGVLMTNGRYRSVLNDAGVFTQQDQRRLLEGSVLDAGDVDGDGLDDLITSTGARLAVTVNAGGGPPDDARGFAGGDYFLELNVRNGPDAGFDDPVDQMRAEFDAWRAERADNPDGSMSSISGAPARVNVQGSQSGPYQFTVTLRNYLGDPASATADLFEIVAPPGRPVPLAVTDVAETGTPGQYTVTAAPTGQTGQSSLWMRINAAPWHAVIMPAPAIEAGLTMADVDADGKLDLSDIAAYLTAFLAGEASADLDGSGTIDMADLNLFVSEFNAG